MKIESLNIHKIQSYKTVPDMIADALKDGILRGTLKGGLPLKQEEIAKKFGVSLIPVREALILLESKGLVTCIRNKGAIVKPLSLEEMKMVFELREILERGVAKIIATRTLQTQLEELRQLADQMEAEEDLYTYNTLNTLFHQILCDAAGNIHLSNAYRDLFIRVERYCMYIIKDLPIKGIINAAHREIISCIEKEDAERFMYKLMDHVEYKEKLFSENNLHRYNHAQFNWDDI